MSAELETLLLPLFSRQARPITAAMAHKMLGAKHPVIAIRLTCSEMGKKGLLTAKQAKGGIQYAIDNTPRTKHEQRTYEWRPLQAMKQTVIPIRERGRMAPDVSDGVYVAMVSRAGYYGRIDA